MGFYIRKAVRLGPLRFNLSKSGVGVSAGVTGARLGMGPRGPYVHGGRHGLYYRKHFGGGSRSRGSARSRASVASQLEHPQLAVIDSADVSQLTDASSAELLGALNTVEHRTPAALIAGVIGALIAAGALMAGASLGVLMVIAVLSAIGLAIAARADNKHGRAALFYEDEPDESYYSLCEAFRALASCDMIRLIEAAGINYDVKRNAGMAVSVRSSNVRPYFGLPRRIDSNVSVPVLPAGKETLYFFPDRLLVYSRGRVGAVSYADLEAKAGATEFVENGAPPRDAQLVRTTWQFVNKDGSRDRRYRDNRELAVVRYGVLDLTSESGLRERFHASRPEAVRGVVQALGEMRRGDVEGMA